MSGPGGRRMFQVFQLPLDRRARRCLLYLIASHSSFADGLRSEECSRSEASCTTSRSSSRREALPVPLASLTRREHDESEQQAEASGLGLRDVDGLEISYRDVNRESISKVLIMHCKILIFVIWSLSRKMCNSPQTCDRMDEPILQ